MRTHTHTHTHTHRKMKSDTHTHMVSSPPRMLAELLAKVGSHFVYLSIALSLHLSPCLPVLSVSLHQYQSMSLYFICSLGVTPAASLGLSVFLSQFFTLSLLDMY